LLPLGGGGAVELERVEGGEGHGEPVDVDHVVGGVRQTENSAEVGLFYLGKYFFLKKQFLYLG
jgi:hypothetical protein